MPVNDCYFFFDEYFTEHRKSEKASWKNNIDVHDVEWEIINLMEIRLNCASKYDGDLNNNRNFTMRLNG